MKPQKLQKQKMADVQKYQTTDGLINLKEFNNRKKRFMNGKKCIIN